MSGDDFSLSLGPNREDPRGPVAASARPARTGPTASAATKSHTRVISIEGAARGERTTAWALDQLVLGRYTLTEILGEGAFGIVYLAFDTRLKRDVAIKVPTRPTAGPAVSARWLKEARTVASLDHPHIVPVYDVDELENGGGRYIVSRFIRGSTLRQLLKDRRLSVEEIVEVVRTVAGALAYAHDRGVIHRDVKPGNILFEAATRKVFVSDFGLAVRLEDLTLTRSCVGTPAYMAPEQILGEWHRLDGRSDLFAVGILFYEMLTGRRPFPGQTFEELRHQITATEPIEPRQIDETIPRELERICLKCLAKRSAHRYASGAALLDDLADWQASAAGPVRQRRRIVVRGLRSFEPEDADFFLELLPGPFGRNGLPESIGFWKRRIESDDPTETFAVGLLTGVSGSGKSSLVKAGLIPQLARHVTPVYAEATVEATEARILHALRRRRLDVPRNLELIESLAWLRRYGTEKTVIFLDQFEQWLNGRALAVESPLVRALRQADGTKVQFILLTREDFAIPAAKLMELLDLPVVGGQNFGIVDRFDRDHARSVLVLLGQAYGRLPGRAADLSAEQATFVDAVVDGLSEEGQIVPVRLAVFAEMVRRRPWEMQSLEALGGTSAIGVRFLEESFAASTANPLHKMHQPAVRGILQALLPPPGLEIKGHMRSFDDLLNASGYRYKRSQFERLLGILDGELRLITPTDPEGSRSSDDPSIDDRHFQLAHDFLVEPIRTWVTMRQRASRRGRAELRLSERAGLWQHRREVKQLPTWREWIAVRLWTDRRTWRPGERDLMRVADAYHVRRSTAVIGIGIGVVAAVLGAGALWRSQVRQDHARHLADSIVTADPEFLPETLRDIEADPQSVRTVLSGPDGPALDGVEPWRRALLMQALGDGTEGSESLEQILFETELEPETFALVADVLGRSTPDATDRAARRLRRGLAVDRLTAAAALAGWDPQHPLVAERSAAIVYDLLVRPPTAARAWAAMFRSRQDALLATLQTTYPDLSDPTEMVTACEIAAALADTPRPLVEWLLEADRDHVGPLLGALESMPRAPYRQALLQSLDRLPAASMDPSGSPTSAADEDELDRIAEQRAALTIALWRLGDEEPLLEGLADRPDPRLQTSILMLLSGGAAPLRPVLDLIEKDRGGPSVRYAGLLALAERTVSFDPEVRGRALAAAHRLYREDCDAGVHSAARLLLGRLDDEPWLHDTDIALEGEPTGERRWLVRGGHTFAVVSSPERTFALATTEMTVEQVRTVLPGTELLAMRDNDGPIEDPVHRPASLNGVYQAVFICQRLSESVLPPDQWCYHTPEDGVTDDLLAPPPRPVDGWLTRGGFRLPTSGEWEIACRAGSTTDRHYGHDRLLLPRYDRLRGESGFADLRVASRWPNRLGLFDLYGNLVEYVSTEPEAGDAVRFGWMGAHFAADPSVARSDYFRAIAPRGLNRSPYLGVRPAFTVKPGPHQSQTDKPMERILVGIKDN